MKPKQKPPAVTVRPAPHIADQLNYQIVSDKKINLTRARAFEFLELDTFQGERQVNENHVQFLFNQWSAGRFMWEHVLIGVCQFNGKYYRINGQHTCWLRVNIDEEVFIKAGECPQVREITYRVADEENLRGLYATFDQNKTRTHAHMIKALMIGSATTSDLWATVIPRLGQALRFWLFEKHDERVMVSAIDINALVQDKYADLFRMVGLFVQKHYTDCVWNRRNPVIAAQFATFQANPGLSPEFWSPVFTGLNLEVKSDPRYQLRKFLDTHRQSTKTDLIPVSAEDSYRICISAWNKWRKGESCQATLRSTDKRQKASK